MNNSLINDFEYISNRVEWERFKGKSFLVTGATGLVGSLFIRALLYASEKFNLKLSISAVIRDLDKAKELFGDSREVKYYIHDFTCDASLAIDEKIDYILHAAAVTASKEMINRPVDNIKTALQGTLQMLDFARDIAGVKMIYLSSMEAYGQMNIDDHLVSENELGLIDLSSVRSCYPEGKRMCECICTAYASQYNIEVVSARLAQTFGPGISIYENRVFAQFARSVIYRKDIVLKTEGLSEGNYVYTADAIVALLILFLKGEKGETYNVVNEMNHMSIRDSANMVAQEIAKGQIQVTYDIPDDISTNGYAATTKMHLSSSKLNNIGWNATVDLKQMYVNLIQYLKEEING